MTHQIRISGRDLAFPCGPDEAVLDAAERAGWALPYSCRKGVCSSCEGGLVSGDAVQRGRGPVAGPRSGVLFCQLRPQSDLEVAPKRIESRTPPARKRVDAFVFRVTQAAPDVTLLQLRFPPQHRVRFRAGQYLQVLLADGARRNYSMASPPQETDGALLHVRRIPGGRFSDAALAPGDTVRVELPFGEFFLREDDRRPVILLASGTGMAPMASIIEDLLRRRSDRPVTLYWGARRQADLYLGAPVERWRQCLPRFDYVPVLSAPDAGWTGRTGRVQDAVMEDAMDLANKAVYAAGNPAMVAGARVALTARGLPEDAFHADAFVASGP